MLGGWGGAKVKLLGKRWRKSLTLGVEPSCYTSEAFSVPGLSLERSVVFSCQHVEPRADVDRSATITAAQTPNDAASRRSGRTLVLGRVKHTDGKSRSVHSSWKPLESRRC